MRPMFPFYGSKWRDARHYPAPSSALVVEPFAGSAGYATYYEPQRVQLCDVDPIIVGVWQFLIGASEAEVLALPDLAVGQSVDDFAALPQEARWLIGFWLNRGSAQPKKTRTAYSARTDKQQLVWSPAARTRIASQLHLIRDWQVRQCSYANCHADDATWFVDPPYGDKGKYYRFHDVNYEDLGRWCQSLTGQVIVCEQDGARWLPFQPFRSMKSSRGTSNEVMWTNA